MIRQKLWNLPVSSGLFNRSLNNCRPQCNGFHNAHRQADLKHQTTQTNVAYHLLGNISLSHEDFKLFGKGHLKSIKPKVKEQVNRMELIRHADTITHEKIITNNPTLYDKKNLTFKKKIDGMEADIEELKRVSEESKRVSDQTIERLERDKKKTYREKKQRYIGETVNMRNRLIQMTSSRLHLQQQQQNEPKWMADARKERNYSAHETDLNTVLMLAHENPGFFDILFDTIYGVPKNEIKLLLDADKTGENQVYNILDDRGSAFHNHYANTCVKPFNSWLSAVRDLQDIQSATMNKASSDHEIYVRKQKSEVKKLVREWDAAFKVDEAKRDTKTKECQKIIWEDYLDRGLPPLIKESIGRRKAKFQENKGMK
ncbi:hypothetical protein ACHAP3_005841 [Botrytis cinerea]